MIGKYRHAINIFKKAIEIDFNYFLSITYIDVNKREIALKECEILKDLDANLVKKLEVKLKNRKIQICC